MFCATNSLDSIARKLAPDMHKVTCHATDGITARQNCMKSTVNSILLSKAASATCLVIILSGGCFEVLLNVKCTPKLQSVVEDYAKFKMLNVLCFRN